MDEFSKPHPRSVWPTDSAARSSVDDSIGSSVDASAGLDGESEAISAWELHEFLEADVLGAPADPAFKRRLRGKLWELVQSRFSKQRGSRATSDRQPRPRSFDTGTDSNPEPGPKRR